jgi:hypothetical protein
VDGPEKIVVEIDLASLWVGGEDGSTFAEHVAAMAARQLMERPEAREATGEYRRRALTIADEEIREHLKPVIAQALDAAVQRTSGFGDPRGEPKTLREVIVEAALEQLRRPAHGDGFGGGIRRGETLVQFVIRREVEDALGKELRGVVQAAKADVLEAVRAKAGEVVAETIEKLAEGRRI